MNLNEFGHFEDCVWMSWCSLAPHVITDRLRTAWPLTYATPTDRPQCRLLCSFRLGNTRELVTLLMLGGCHSNILLLQCPFRLHIRIHIRLSLLRSLSLSHSYSHSHNISIFSSVSISLSLWMLCQQLLLIRGCWRWIACDVDAAASFFFFFFFQFGQIHLNLNEYPADASSSASFLSRFPLHNS